MFLGCKDTPLSCSRTYISRQNFNKSNGTLNDSELRQYLHPCSDLDVNLSVCDCSLGFSFIHYTISYSVFLVQATFMVLLKIVFCITNFHLDISFPITYLVI